MKKPIFTILVVIFAAIAGCLAGVIDSHEISENCEDTEEEVDLTIEKYLGLWKSKDGNFEIEVTESEFRYLDRSEESESTGEFTLLKDRLWLGHPDDDGGYVKIKGQGKIILSQEGAAWEIELAKVD